MQQVGYRLATYALLAGALVRVVLIVILDPHYIDFYCFVDAAQALMRGVDPFKLENLLWVRWEEAPLVYPGLALFFIPFAPIAFVALHWDVAMRPFLWSMGTGVASIALLMIVGAMLQ